MINSKTNIIQEISGNGLPVGGGAGGGGGGGGSRNSSTAFATAAAEVFSSSTRDRLRAVGVSLKFDDNDNDDGRSSKCRRCRNFVGRDHELQRMTDAFSRVEMRRRGGCAGTSVLATASATATKELVIINGPAGTGKSALAERCLEHIKGRCVYGRGKCRRRERKTAVSEPFAPFVEALEELLDNLPSKIKGEAFRCLHKSEQAALKTLCRSRQINNGNSCSSYINNNNKAPANMGEFTYERVRFTIRNYIRQLAECSKLPLVLLLDDVQWAEHDLCVLVDAIVLDKSVGNVLFIVTKRTDSEKEHSAAADSIGLVAPPTVNIDIDNLTVPQIGEYLARLLSTETECVHDLAELVHNKTAGNAFFMVQFVRALEQKGLITYNIASTRWVWDVGQINSSTDISDNVIDLVVSKIMAMQETCKLAMTAAACLGQSRFSTETLYVVLIAIRLSHEEEEGHQEHHDHNHQDCVLRKGNCHEVCPLGMKSHEDLVPVLQQCVQKGFLESVATDATTKVATFKFSHDRILESCLSLVPSDRRRIDFHAGRLLLDLRDDVVGDSWKKDQLLLLSVYHLNGGRWLISNEDCFEIAALNLQAAEIVFQKAAVFMALEYLEVGDEQLSFAKYGSWDVAYSLTLKLKTKLAETLYFCRRPDKCKVTCDEILSKARRFKDELPVHRIAMRLAFDKDKDMGMKEACRVASIGGLKIKTAPPTKLDVLSKIVRLELKMRHMTDDDFLLLPPRPLDETSCELLGYVIELCELSYECNYPLQFGYIAVSIIEWSLSKNILSPTSYVLLASINVKHGKLQKAERKKFWIQGAGEMATL